MLACTKRSYPKLTLTTCTMTTLVFNMVFTIVVTINLATKALCKRPMDVAHFIRCMNPAGSQGDGTCQVPLMVFILSPTYLNTSYINPRVAKFAFHTDFSQNNRKHLNFNSSYSFNKVNLLEVIDITKSSLHLRAFVNYNE